MLISIGYEDSLIAIKREDGRKVMIARGTCPHGCQPNLYRHLQDTIALLESVLTLGTMDQKWSNNNG